jgi:GNAT superfamily N-acetyltransferase
MPEVQLFQAKTDEDRQHVREIFWEYLEWANALNQSELGVSFDIASLLEHDMAELDKFAPPEGRLLLAERERQIIGIACLRKISAEIGEVKRMYVRPAFRGQGIGRALVERLIAEARQAGYRRLRLDSARYMKSAHALYRSVGFTEIDAYPESEIPPDFQAHWVFMELRLEPSD